MNRDFSITVPVNVPIGDGWLALNVPAIYNQTNDIGRVVVERDQLLALLVVKCVSTRYVQPIISAISRLEFRYSPLVGVRRVEKRFRSVA